MSQTLIPAAQSFYTNLAANNSKAWWDENRAPYDNILKPAALALLDDLSSDLESLAGVPVTSKLFRPHRDVRFSKDKSPYQTHLHMMWALECGARQSPVFFFGIGTDYVTVGTGIMGFDKPVLEDWRKFVDLDSKRILGIIDQIGGKGFTLREPALKRVPTAYPTDHPAGHLLRMKGCVATTDIRSPVDLRGAILTACKNAHPLTALLLQIAEA